MRSKMDARDYFIQKWQIYSKWYANSSCFSLPGACAENRVSQAQWGKCHDWFPCLLGLVPSHLSLVLFPICADGKSMLRDLRVAHRHTAWYWQSHGKSSPLPDSVPDAPRGLALVLLLESSWEACQITPPLRISSWPCFSVSCQIVASSGQTALKRNAMWNANLRPSMRLLSQGFCWAIAERDPRYKWWMSTEFGLGTGWAKGEWSRKNQSQLSI